jgi:CO/xanthine dehydrogenase Mo-binding subunit
MEELKVVGKSIPRVDAVGKVTGRAVFTADFVVPGMIHAKVLRSPYPHARIRGIDTSKAEGLAGVRAIVAPKDAPPASIGLFLGDQYVLCHDNTVRCIGDPVAAVAADTEEIAEGALELMKVDYEEMPAVFDAEEAFRKDPPVIVHPALLSYKPGPLPWWPDPERPNVCHTYKIRSGDVVRGFQEADLIVENRYTTARIAHCQLESHVVVAWFEPDGGLTVMTPCQLPYSLKPLLCKLFNLSSSKVRLLSTFVGGAFGAKGQARAELMAALLAQKSRRPVRLAFTREEMFRFGGHRVPMVFDIRDGVKSNGTLVARDVKALLALGAYSDTGFLLVKRTPIGAVGTYRVPNFKLDCYGVYTNEPLTTALRGFGAPEIQWAIEQQMDIIAERLGIDPVEIRRRNVLNEGDRDACGMVTHSVGVTECLERVRKWIGWGKKPADDSAPWKRGKGIAIGNKSIQTGVSSVVIVKVWQDGVVEVRHSVARLGQGTETCLAQIAADQFGIPISQVRVVSGDTAFCPPDFGTVASVSLVHNGNALISACQDAKQQLFELAAPVLGAEPKDLTTGDGKIYVKGAEPAIRISRLFTPLGIPLKGGKILGIGSFTSPYSPEDLETGQSERYVFSYSYGANAVEVAINVETGEVKVLRIASAFDMGKAVNPSIVEQQIEGGVTMGISCAFEEVSVDKGTVFNNGFVDYPIFTAMDMPEVENISTMIVEVAHQEGPFGAKGIGEVPLVAVAPAIANAVYNAIGIRIKDLPISRQRVLGDAGMVRLGKL